MIESAETESKPEADDDRKKNTVVNLAACLLLDCQLSSLKSIQNVTFGGAFTEPCRDTLEQGVESPNAQMGPCDELVARPGVSAPSLRGHCRHVPENAEYQTPAASGNVGKIGACGK